MIKFAKKIYHKIKCLLIVNLRWNRLSVATGSPISKSVALLPIIGYVIIWSDKTISFFQFRNLGDDLWFGFIERLYLIYFGGLFVLFLMIVFYCFCPKMIKEHGSEYEYFEYFRNGHNHSKVVECLREVSKLAKCKSGLHLRSDHLERVLEKFRLPTGPWDGSKINKIFSDKSYEEDFFSLSRELYYQHNESYLFARISCGFFLLIGATLLLLPSLEVFLKVIFTITPN